MVKDKNSTLYVLTSRSPLESAGRASQAKGGWCSGSHLTEIAVDDFAARCWTDLEASDKYARALNYMELATRRRSLAPVGRVQNQMHFQIIL